MSSKGIEKDHWHEIKLLKKNLMAPGSLSEETISIKHIHSKFFREPFRFWKNIRFLALWLRLNLSMTSTTLTGHSMQLWNFLNILSQSLLSNAFSMFNFFRKSCVIRYLEDLQFSFLISRIFMYFWGFPLKIHMKKYLYNDIRIIRWWY